MRRAETRQDTRETILVSARFQLDPLSPRCPFLLLFPHSALRPRRRCLLEEAAIAFVSLCFTVARKNISHN